MWWANEDQRYWKEAGAGTRSEKLRHVEGVKAIQKLYGSGLRQRYWREGRGKAGAEAKGKNMRGIIGGGGADDPKRREKYVKEEGYVYFIPKRKWDNEGEVPLQKKCG